MAGRKGHKKGRKKGAKRGAKKGARHSSAKRGAAKRTTLHAGMVVAKKPSKKALSKHKLKATKVGRASSSIEKGQTVHKIARRTKRRAKK